MKMKLAALSLAALGTVASGGAHAKAEATASLTNIQFTLFDLNPFDGIAPSITFLGGSQSSFSVHVMANGGTDSMSVNKTGGFGAIGSGQASIDQGSASAKVTKTEVSASGSIVGSSNAPYWNQNSFSASAALLQGTSFSLSPYTLLAVSADAFVRAATTGGVGIGWGGEGANANATVTLSGQAAGGGAGSQYSTDSRSASAYSWVYYDYWNNTWVSHGSSDWNSGKIGASFANLTGSALTGMAAFGVSLNGHSSLAPVPEPETYALMLAGLAAIGATVRRRQRA